MAFQKTWTPAALVPVISLGLLGSPAQNSALSKRAFFKIIEHIANRFISGKNCRDEAKIANVDDRNSAYWRPQVDVMIVAAANTDKADVADADKLALDEEKVGTTPQRSYSAQIAFFCQEFSLDHFYIA